MKVKYKNKKLLVLQRVIPKYHVELFKQLTASKEINCKVIIGQDTTKLKAKNASNLSEINYEILPSKIFNFFGRKLTYHIGLLDSIKKNKPDVLLCEAESHVLGYYIALIYKYFFNRKVKLVLWCFFKLPGKRSAYKNLFIEPYKKIIRKLFDGFLSYHSYGKLFLISDGINENKISVAVNVCDTKKLLNQSKKLSSFSKEEIKNKLGYPNKFIISYIGTLDTPKNPNLVLEIAKKIKDPNIHFFMLGDGPLFDKIIHKQREMKLNNITIFGRVNKNIYDYYYATDLLIVPGRGGIIISEAMCFGVPAIVYKADGVEFDLVKNMETGFIVKGGEAEEFLSVINNSYNSTDLLSKLGANAKNLIEKKYNIKNMSEAIIKSTLIQ